MNRESTNQQPNRTPDPCPSHATSSTANTATTNTTEDLSSRFERNMAVRGIGAAGQERLRRARVAVVGAGGLGSAVLPYLVGAGVEHIGIADFDTVSTSNLCRQVLYPVAQVGTPKVAAAASYLRARSPELQVTDLGRIEASNAREALADFDLVLECSDNFATKALVAETCRDLHLPLVWGTAVGVTFQVTVLWNPPASIPPLLRRAGYGDDAASRGASSDSDMSEASRLAPHEDAKPNTNASVSAIWPYPATTLTDLYPAWPEMAQATHETPAYDSATQGILGATCAAAGSVMVAEAVKLLTGAGQLLCGRVLTADLWAPSWRVLVFKGN